MSDTSIEWTDKVWNPLRGCSKVSEGCKNCYAIKTAHRFSGEGQPFEGLTENSGAGVNWTGKVMLVHDKLLEPIKWRKPAKIFVNSMSDVFHPNVPEYYIDQIFGVMLANHLLNRQAKHSFQLLTKRPERMQQYFSVGQDILINRWSESLDGIVIMDDADIYFSEYVSGFMDHDEFFPLPNLWLGVSVENQKAADERIPLLLQTPASIRFLSCEPLLGLVDLKKVDNPTDNGKVDWVIAGGESGPGARPMHPEWVRSLRDQCKSAGVAFHFKQWGEWLSVHPDRKSYEFSSPPEKCKEIDGTRYYRIGKKAAGRKLDGRTWDEFPEVHHG